MKIFKCLREKIGLSGSNRTVSAKKNVLFSFFLKIISIFISLQIVPLTINYINPSQYGIWLTLSSIIAWVSYFDLGIAHGFRNRFTEAVAVGETNLARKYVSTTYAIITAIVIVLFIIIAFLNYSLNWCSILNIDEISNSELQKVFFVLSSFFCLNMVANIFTTMLMANQKPALSSLIQTGGQLLAFIVIYMLTRFSHGELIYLAFVFSGIPCLLLLIVSFVVFRTKTYNIYSPKLSYIDITLIKQIMGLGWQFFIITISMLLIFQFMNIIISRIEGPEAVTQYNIAYKYFNVLNMIAVIVLTPFWSAFTDAYTKRDFEWMKTMKKRLEQMWCLCIPITILMLVFSKSIYSYWIGPSIIIPFSLSMYIAIYVLFQTLGNVYMYLINGIGKIRLQLIIYMCFSVISIPLMVFGCKKWGLQGVLIAPILVYIIQALIGRIQINRIINCKAKGLWNK